MTLKSIILTSLAALAFTSAAGQQPEPVLTEVLFRKGDAGVHTYRIPSLVQAADGSIVAFAEARQNGGGDTGDIDLVARRSTDGGKTWGEIITVWDDGENVCGNPCPVVDRETGRIILLSTWNNGKDPEKAIHERTSIDTRRVFVLYSDDNGLTWSDAREITTETKLPEWTWYATGPCHAIQLSKGPHKGRIVVPCNHGVFGNGTVSHIIYSDDAGETWHIGGNPGVGNESTVTELRNGDIMLNMRGPRDKDRVEKGAARLVAISHDGGITFDEPYLDKSLIEPVCNASIINYAPKGKPTGTVLFSNPDHMTRRKDMTVKQSDDSGKTWRTAFRLSDLPAAYSDLLVLENGDVAVFYETGEKTSYDTMTFTVIPSEAFKK